MSLNCEGYQIKIVDRGGTNPVVDIPEFISLKWDRRRDDISEAIVTADGSCADFSAVEAGRHELLILRNGDRVWEGPLTLPSFRRGVVSFKARDPWHYSYRTIMRSAYNNAYPNNDFATERIRTILETEWQRTGGWEDIAVPINVLPYLEITTNEDTAGTSRLTKEFEKTVWEEIDDMAAHSGIDYTAVGRRLLVFDTHDVIGRTVQLSDEDFDGDLVISQYGMNLCTFSAVTDGMGNWSARAVDEDYYGPWEMLFTSFAIQDQIQCDAAGALDASLAEMGAQSVRNIAGRYPTPVVVRVPDNSRLNPSCGLTMDDLVPGVRVPVQTSQAGRTVAQEQKLDRVTFDVDSKGEAITVTLSPAPGTLVLDDAAGGDSGGGA